MIHYQSNYETWRRSNRTGGRSVTGICPLVPIPALSLHQIVLPVTNTARQSQVLWHWSSHRSRTEVEDTWYKCHDTFPHCLNDVSLKIMTFSHRVWTGPPAAITNQSELVLMMKPICYPSPTGNKDFRSQWSLVLACFLKMSWTSSQEPNTLYCSSPAPYPQRTWRWYLQAGFPWHGSARQQVQVISHDSKPGKVIKKS